MDIVEKHESIEARCPSCMGTGLQRLKEFCEKSEAIVCSTCRGSGKITFSYQPFTGRVKMTDIEHVWLKLVRSSGTMVKQGRISYDEFLDGKFKPDKNTRNR